MNEKEIARFDTGIAVTDEFFLKKESMSADDLIAAFHELNQRCDGIIKYPGIYAIRMQIVKLK